MKIGHLFWQPTPDMNYSHHQRLSETEELVQMCEQLGFWGVSFGENHFSNYGYSPNPLMLAVGLGRRTERLNIATGVAVLPYWNPIRFAEDARHCGPAPERPPRTRGRPRIPAAGVRRVRAALRRAPGTFHRGARDSAAGLDPS